MKGLNPDVCVGKMYGNWTVLGVGHPIGKQNRQSLRCLCVCGVERDVNLSDILRGSSNGCGCSTYGNTKHGDCTSGVCRLYRCWQSMKERSINRTKAGRPCGIYPAWEKYDAFREWAINSGYRDDLCLCRNGDVGDYTPYNCRWDTQAANMAEARSGKYTAVSPDGVLTHITNLSKFCRDNNLNRGMMRKVMNGKFNQHKRWTDVNKC